MVSWIFLWPKNVVGVALQSRILSRYERRVVIDLVFVFIIWLQFVVYEKKKKNWNSDPDSDSRTDQLLFRLMMKLGKTKSR